MDWKALEEEVQDLIVSRLPEHALEDIQSMERFTVRYNLIALHVQVEQTKQLANLVQVLSTIANVQDAIRRLTPHD